MTDIRPQLVKEIVSGCTVALSLAIENVLGQQFARVTCITCVHFKEYEGEICNLAPGKMRPPARIIAKGCPSYCDNLDVPF